MAETKEGAVKAKPAALPGGLVDFGKLLDAKYGEGTTVLAPKPRKLRRLRTGIFNVDFELGGGLVLGRFHMIWGPESSGKTTLCGKIIAQAQRHNRHDFRLVSELLEMEPEYVKLPTKKSDKATPVSAGEALEETIAEDIFGDEYVVWRVKEGYDTLVPPVEPLRTLFINQEGKVDTAWLERLGVDLSHVLFSNLESGAQAVDVLEAALRSGEVDLIILDSLANMPAQDELSKSAEGYTQGSMARLLNKAFRKWVAASHDPAIKKRDVKPTIVVVNQVREKIGVMFGNPETKPGGKGQEFAPSTSVRLNRGAKEEGDYAKKEEGGHQIISRTRFTIDKNGTAPKGGKGQYAVVSSAVGGWRPGEIMQGNTVLNLARRYGAVYQYEKGKKEWHAGPKTFRTLKEVKAWFVSDDPEYQEFEDELLRVLCQTRTGVL